MWILKLMLRLIYIEADAAKITSSPLLTKASRSSLLLLLSADHEK